MNERIKQLRELLNLSQNEFSSKVNIGRSTLSMFESGQRDLKDIHISQICSVFNVSEDWLKYGKGEMFESLPRDELDKLAARYKLNPMAKRIVECFVTLDENEMNAVLKFVKDIASTTYDETAATRDSYYNYSGSANSNDTYINEELNNYRLELEAEKKGEISSVYADIGDRQAK